MHLMAVLLGITDNPNVIHKGNNISSHLTPSISGRLAPFHYFWQRGIIGFHSWQVEPNPGVPHGIVLCNRISSGEFFT
jgi:hypothetical protein